MSTVDQLEWPPVRHNFESMEAAMEKFFELGKSAPASIEHVFVWNSDMVRNWFFERGYQLYVFQPAKHEFAAFDLCYPASFSGLSNHIPSTSKIDQDMYPFAYYSSSDNVRPPLGTLLDSKAIVFYAENREGHHVAIKIVEDGSNECEVLRNLHAQGLELGTTKRIHVVPILDMLPSGKYWFCVMPRWGVFSDLSAFTSIKQIFQVIRCMLKALNYLHEKRIFHGDIKRTSILVNHFDNQDPIPPNYVRSQLRYDDKLDYSLFDFSHSIQFPSDTVLADCRLSYKEAWRGTWGYIPNDTSQGEFEFNPFAWDVCAMGLTLGPLCEPILDAVPMLVPLLDRMLTRRIPTRFTAAEALQFFEQEVYSHTTPTQLEQPYPKNDYPEDCNPDADRWCNLDPQFIKEWAVYREPRLRRRTKLLRRLCALRPFNDLIPLLRRLGTIINTKGL